MPAYAMLGIFYHESQVFETFRVVMRNIGVNEKYLTHNEQLLLLGTLVRKLTT